VQSHVINEDKLIFVGYRDTRIQENSESDDNKENLMMRMKMTDDDSDDDDDGQIQSTLG
jgi:hypothetical protein